jgi:RNA polymerase sigma-B factor
MGRQERTDALLARLHEPARALGAAERLELVNEVVTLNTPLARRIAGRYAGRGCALEDLEQTACLALVLAVHRYDPSTGHHFLAYVVPCITGSVKRHFRDQGWMVRPPRSVQELQTLVDHERRHTDTPDGRPPSESEIAARVGAPVEAVRQALLARGCFTPASLETSVLGVDGVLLRDTLVEPRGTQAYDAVEARAVLGPVLAALDPTERRLLRLRFVEECSQREMAGALGMSQSRVSRVLTSVLLRLRAAIDESGRGFAEPAA